MLADVFVTLIFYRPNGAMWGLRLFEFFVMALVFGVSYASVSSLPLSGTSPWQMCSEAIYPLPL